MTMDLGCHPMVEAVVEAYVTAPEVPLVTAIDVPSWRRLGLFWILALAIAIAVYFVVTGAELDDDLPLAAILATFLIPLQFLLGSRRVELFADRVRVTRRGKVRLEIELVALRLILHVPTTDAYWLWFGGARTVFIPANSASFCTLLDHCKTMMRPND